MAKSYASTVINASAEDVWARIRDFNGLATWHSGLVATSEIEDGRAGDQVGGTRSFTLTDLRDWWGVRAQAGRLPPKGFPKSGKFGQKF